MLGSGGGPIWPCGTVGQRACLSRRRSRVRAPPRSPRRSSLRTAQESQSLRACEFLRLCFGPPPSPHRTRCAGLRRGPQLTSSSNRSDGSLSSCKCGFESRRGHHVGRSLLHSVSAVCVRAAKTPYPQSPSSFSPSNPASMGSPMAAYSSGEEDSSENRKTGNRAWVRILPLPP